MRIVHTQVSKEGSRCDAQAPCPKLSLLCDDHFWVGEFWLELCILQVIGLLDISGTSLAAI